ncbi:MAG: DNA polymerase III subunit beta [Chloroflexi bacterium RBG_13_54_8]|nr:MAG: DNA polymerase III subunit beta [Chloroflexi bacterium RBG_13_54_8]
MKLSCLQENLSKGLGIVGRAVATRTTLPITNNVLMATEDSRLKLSATNLEIAISCWLGAAIEKEGAITLPARLLNEFVNSLPSDRIDLNLSEHTLELKCARFEARISGLDAEDFPPIPQIGNGSVYKIEPEALRLAINQVVFATASEDTRPVLTGVCVEFDSDILSMAAADGFRLAVHKASLAAPAEERAEVIIPGRSLLELGRLLADLEEVVEIAVAPNKSQIFFRLSNVPIGNSTGRVEMVSQLLQGSFPNYRQLIPQSYSTRTVVNTSEFLRATKTASIFARDGSGIVRIQMTPGDKAASGKMSISARSEQVGDNMGEIDAQVTGEAAKIAFNGKYVTDVLSVVYEGQIALEATTPSSPGVFHPIGSDKYVHIIMPMFVQW